MKEAGKRILFKKRGAQKKFIESVRSKMSAKDISEICNCSERTIRDWQRERFSMDLKCAQLISRRSRIPIPSSVHIREKYWYVTKAGAAGGKATINKFGKVPVDEEYRKECWANWWQNTDKKAVSTILYKRLSIKNPKYSIALAEFCGIMLGDGSIQPKQILITINRESDREYADYVSKLIKDLFGVTPARYYRGRDNTCTLVVSRVELVEFCISKLGLVAGNKTAHQVSISDWIKNNKSYRRACVRGLVDTDGCVFDHTYTVKNKEYKYKKISYTSASKPLRKNVYDILLAESLKPHERNGRDIRLESKKDVEQYFKIIGTSNPKHLKRYTS